jgi:hypothetical protein
VYGSTPTRGLDPKKTDARYLFLHFVSRVNSWFYAVKATCWSVLICGRALLGRQSEGVFGLVKEEHSSLITLVREINLLAPFD